MNILNNLKSLLSNKQHKLNRIIKAIKSNDNKKAFASIKKLYNNEQVDKLSILKLIHSSVPSIDNNTELCQAIMQIDRDWYFITTNQSIKHNKHNIKEMILHKFSIEEKMDNPYLNDLQFLVDVCFGYHKYKFTPERIFEFIKESSKEECIFDFEDIKLTHENQVNDRIDLMKIYK